MRRDDAALAKSPLVTQAVEDLLAGAAVTAPFVGGFVPPREIGVAPQNVTAACAIGALQVGYSLRLGLAGRVVAVDGLLDEEQALLDAYRARHGTSLIRDNDCWGRDAVVARCKELANSLPAAGPEV